MSLRYVLLALLSEKPNSGYGLGRLLSTDLSHIWDACLQQVYGEMAKLDTAGLVEAESIEIPNRPAKKIYSLTPLGQVALDVWLAEFSPQPSNKDDLLMKLYCLERSPKDATIRRLEERRNEYQEEEAELRHQLAKTTQTESVQLGLVFTLEAAKARAEGQVAWCDSALAWLRKRELPGEIEEPFQQVVAGT